MKTFHWAPGGMPSSVSPSVTTIKFGDGYEQRRPTGLNHQLINFQPVFRITSDNSRTALEAFLVEHGGYKAFCGDRQNTTARLKLSAGNGLLRTTSRILISAVNLSRSLLKDPMQDIPQNTLNETTKTEQSARIDLWEIDLTAFGGQRYYFSNEANEKGEPVTGRAEV